MGLMSHAWACDTVESTAMSLTAKPAAAANDQRAEDKAALRAWFHRPEFNTTDELNTYAEDYRTFALAEHKVSCDNCLSDTSEACATPVRIQANSCAHLVD